MFKQLVSQTDDTRVAVGAESIAGALQVYKYVQAGVRTMSDSTAADQLGKVFQKIQPESTPASGEQTPERRSCARTCDS